MKKLLWLLLLPAVLAGWIMTPNPGMELWVNDSLRYGIYKTSTTIDHQKKVASDLDGGYCLLLNYDATTSSGAVIQIVYVIPSASVSTDSVIVYAKKAPTNSSSRISLWARVEKHGEEPYTYYFNFSSQTWVTSYASRIFYMTNNWQRFAFPIRFTRPGYYHFYFKRVDTPSDVDSFWVDSFYIKRPETSAKLCVKGRKDPILLGAIPYFINEGRDYEEAVFKSGLRFSRITDRYAEYLVSMDAASNSWSANWAAYDSTWRILTHYGYTLFLSFYLIDYSSKGMRYYTVGDITLPYREDASFYMSKSLQHVDSLVDAHDYHKIFGIAFLNEKASHIDTEEEADSFWALYRTIEETVRTYFPDVYFTSTGGLRLINTEYAGWFPDSFDVGAYHLYGASADGGPYAAARRPDDYDLYVLGNLYEFTDTQKLRYTEFPFLIFDEEFTSLDQRDAYEGHMTEPFQWLPLPGLMGITHTQVIESMEWTWLPTDNSGGRKPAMQIGDSLYTPYYAYLFLSKYQGKKTYYSDFSYSPALFCKVEPETYIISNPLPRDTIEVQLPKAGIARVRWLDPDTEFPIIRTENRSPIYEKTMAIRNRLRIPPGYMYAIEFKE